MSSSKKGSILNHYKVLGVAHDADQGTIKKAFRKLAQECHPDKAGADPEAPMRFAQVREAYEVLSDPGARTRYDAQLLGRKRLWGKGGAFRMPGGFVYSGAGAAGRAQPGSAKRRRGRKDQGLDLDDIIGGQTQGGRVDFGFGGEAEESDFDRRAPRQNGGAYRTQASRPGRDIILSVDVAEKVVRRGGTVTLYYPRMRRSEDGRSLFRYDEIFELRVPPGTSHGDSMRIQRMGDEALDHDVDGDLVCDIRVIMDVVEPSRAPPRDDFSQKKKRRKPQKESNRTKKEAADVGKPDHLRVPVSLEVALLGGQVVVDTPTGRLRLTVPACTSSGAIFRVRGRGADGSDLHLEMMIHVPSEIDDASQALIREFGVLNPFQEHEG